MGNEKSPETKLILLQSNVVANESRIANADELLLN